MKVTPMKLGRIQIVIRTPKAITILVAETVVLKPKNTLILTRNPMTLRKTIMVTADNLITRKTITYQKRAPTTTTTNTCILMILIITIKI
jgi:hypothetical protein